MEGGVAGVLMKVNQDICSKDVPVSLRQLDYWLHIYWFAKFLEE